MTGGDGIIKGSLLVSGGKAEEGHAGSSADGRMTYGSPVVDYLRDPLENSG